MPAAQSSFCVACLPQCLPHMPKKLNKTEFDWKNGKFLKISQLTLILYQNSVSAQFASVAPAANCEFLSFCGKVSPSSRSRCHKAYQCHPGPAAKVFLKNLTIIFIWIVLHLGNQPGVWRWRGNGGAARRRTGRHSLLIQAMLNIIYLIKHSTFKHSQFYAISWTFKRLHKDNGWHPNWYWH